jgi:hypothetical protein
VPAHACSRADIVAAAARGFGSILRVEGKLTYTKVQFVLSKGAGRPTSFVVAYFPHAQLRRLPAD